MLVPLTILQGWSKIRNNTKYLQKYNGIIPIVNLAIYLILMIILICSLKIIADSIFRGYKREFCIELYKVWCLIYIWLVIFTALFIARRPKAFKSLWSFLRKPLWGWGRDIFSVLPLVKVILVPYFCSGFSKDAERFHEYTLWHVILHLLICWF